MTEIGIQLRHQDAYDRLKQVLSIDTTDLDSEFIHLAIIQMEVSEFTCEASDYKEKADHALEIAIAVASQELRKPLDDKGKEPSEAKIRLQVPLEGIVQEAKNAANDAKYQFELWRGLSKSFETKTKAIERVCDLILRGYATPDKYVKKEYAAERAKRKA